MPVPAGTATVYPGLVEQAIGAGPVTVTVNGHVLPAAAVGPLTITRGRTQPDQRPDASTLTVTLSTDHLVELPRLGDPVAVDLSAAAETYFAAPASAVPRFRGSVTDLAARPVDAVTGEARLTLVAAGNRATLAGIDVGTDPWPAELDGARADRVLTAAAADNPAIDVAFVDVGTLTVAGRDPAKVKAGQLLDDLAVSTGGELVERRDGRLAWHDAAHRDSTPVAVTLAAADVIADAMWRQNLSGLLNDLTLTYAAGTVTVTDTTAIAETKMRGQQDITTDLAGETDALTRATDLVGRYGWPRWRLDVLPVDLLRTVDPAQGAALLALDFADLLEVVGFPTTGPFVEAQLWVEGSTEEITRHGWRLSLNVAEFGLTATPPRWADVPGAGAPEFRLWNTRTRTWQTIPADGLRWVDVDLELTWLAAVSWQLPQVSIDRWIDQPGNHHWNTDPVVTWATF